ncbi:hypothetical protein TMatcc_010305 [Talaromyces marneffei ATCC 18224]|uniref:MFS transporter, putative n=1 Tax=Talaromyces marneffei (strain ATCC 18224 / CBS 334.59 / QM 7333) TaxID=441960 RepID=B6QVT7_TALMQ|nr:uncharacterized protein EYB26_009898 [Talaromyces marneffei]EEA19150.1 MFS transporter, putative [Talaromyces marneffei ATCC 18224]KAE8548840.1 hypothetical protein EYB25_009222 [Talaromyces marneffei]QGA22183.1 hypothetical protein EYB26_009898 [Talaromyces marneffei]
MAYSEQSPLLEERPQQSYQKQSTWNATRICILCYIGALLFDSAQILRTMPRTKLFESVICQKYYAPTDIPEDMCKVYPVQEELVTTQTWLKVGESVCALLVALPFGNIANTKGRSLVLTLAISGQILADLWILAICFFNQTLPLSLVYVSPLLRSIGGGEMVMSAIIHTLLVDVVTKENRAQAFFNMAVMTLIAELVAPAVGSMLVDWQGVYLPLLCSFPLQVGTMVIFGLLPDTRLPKNLEIENGCDPVEGRHLTEESDKGAFTNWVKSLKRSYSPFQTKAIWLVTVCYISTMLARDTIDFLVQYASKQFEWSLAKANYLISVKALVSMALYVLILPLLSKALVKKYSMSPPIIDLWIARGSSLFGVVGPILLGMASGPVVLVIALVLFAFSLGFPFSIQVYGTSLVEPVEVAPFYSALVVLRIAVTLLTSPLLAMAFKYGLNAGGAASGLIFDIAGGLFFIAAVGSFLLG